MRLQASMLTPCDAFTCDVLVDAEEAAVLLPGMKVQFAINGRPQLTGYIDKRSVRSSRGGTEVTISGRDILGPVVDATMDPKVKFIDTMTLADLVASVLVGFGITTIYNDGSL